MILDTVLAIWAVAATFIAFRLKGRVEAFQQTLAKADINMAGYVDTIVAAVEQQEANVRGKIDSMAKWLRAEMASKATPIPAEAIGDADTMLTKIREAKKGLEEKEVKILEARKALAEALS